MRPLYLEMTAFGSYAELTKLPFEEMKGGLYLVTDPFSEKTRDGRPVW